MFIHRSRAISCLTAARKVIQELHKNHGKPFDLWYEWRHDCCLALAFGANLLSVILLRRTFNYFSFCRIQFLSKFSKQFLEKKTGSLSKKENRLARYSNLVLIKSDRTNLLISINQSINQLARQ